MKHGHVILALALLTSPGILSLAAAGFDDPVVGQCSGPLVRVGVDEYFAPLVAVPGRPYEGFVDDYVSGSTGLFVLANQGNLVNTPGGEDSLIWYWMSGTTGKDEYCYPVVCNPVEDRLRPVTSPEAFALLIEAAETLGCLSTNVEA